MIIGRKSENRGFWIYLAVIFLIAFCSVLVGQNSSNQCGQYLREHYLSPEDFLVECFKNHDHEVLWNNKAQNLFINVNGIVGESTIKETATLLLEFYNLYVKNPIETSPKISINRLTNMYEILLPGCIVQNFTEKQKLLVEFTKYLGDNDRYYISAAISENLKGKDKNYTTRTLEINEYYDGEIKDLLADVKSSEVSNVLVV